MKLGQLMSAALVLVSMGSAAAEPPPVRLIGRVAVDASGQFEAQWSASGFEAEFKGSKVVAIIDDSGENFLNVEIDGRVSVLGLKAGRTSYTLFAGENGAHTIKVMRRTSPMAAPTRFISIRSDGVLTPTTSPARRMLVIGDSIAAGYGVEGDGPNCKFSYETQNAAHAYGVLTAKALGADVHVVAVDGRGLIHNWGGFVAPTMRDLEAKTLPTRSTIWPASSYRPDVIVVHLGTNDFGGNDPQPAFGDAYVRLLSDLRSRYPNALIYGAIGPSLSGVERQAASKGVKDAIETRRKTGDAKVRFIEFNIQDSPHAWGCDWHPSYESQLAIARALAASIESELSWQAVQAIEAPPHA